MEYSIGFAKNMVMYALPMTAMPDVREAYYSIPRKVLQSMRDEHQLSALIRDFRPPRSPMSIMKKH